MRISLNKISVITVLCTADITNIRYGMLDKPLAFTCGIGHMAGAIMKSLVLEERTIAQNIVRSDI